MSDAPTTIVAPFDFIPLRFAPTGRDSIAQGNALGGNPPATISPNGARFVIRVVCVIAPRNESRPVGALAFVATVTQGCALGYRMWPRWGRRRGCHTNARSALRFAPTGRDSIAQGNALGGEHASTGSPNGARFVNRVVRAIRRGDELRPVGAWAIVVTVPQGCALGYRIRPRWGQEQSRATPHQIGGLGRAYELFGEQLAAILEELNARLAA